MALITIVSNALRALAAYYELKCKTHRHDAYMQSKKRIERIEREIEKLRNNPSVDSTIAADRLLYDLEEEKRYSAYLSDADTQD